MDYGKLPYSRLFRDFVNRGDDITSFYEFPHHYDELQKAVSSYRFGGDRDEMARIVSEFNSGFTLADKAKEHLASLSDPETVTITTGQQVSLFGGPLYVIYKALTIINLAGKLTRDTNKRVVPVFWLADEDHDYDEVAAVSLAGKNGTERFHLPCKTCERHAAGMIPIGEDFESFRRDVYSKLPDTDFHREVTELLDESYVRGRTLRHAFGELLARLLSKHGLIFAGSNFPDAKKAAAYCFRTAINKTADIASALGKQSDRLSGLYHQQAQITDSLLFWHDEQHGRMRLAHQSGMWTISSGESFSTEELLDKLDSDPGRFSPNVFLRPIVQDTLLPNAAYVAGPAEIAYYAQMRPVYQLFGKSMPFIASRITATIAEPPVQRFLKELPFDFSDFSKRPEDLEQEYLRRHSDPDLDQCFEEWKKKISELSESKIKETGISDPGLNKHAQAITKEYHKAIDKLRKKMVNQVRQKEEMQINRIKKSRNALFPDGHLQEREISFIYFMNKFGVTVWDDLLTSLENHKGVFSQHFRVDL